MMCPRGHDSERNRWNQCKACNAERQRRYYWADPEASRLRDRGYSRRKYFKKVHGLTPEEADAIVSAGCGVCGGPGEVIDHSHATGLRRGPLCHRCNKVLGLAHDDPEVLRALASYLDSHFASPSDACIPVHRSLG